MKKLIMKKSLLIIFVVLLLISISTISLAVSLPDIRPNVNTPGANQVKSVAQIILGIVQIIAVAVAVVMLVVMAIKYMAAAPSEKADIKKGLIAYVIGALILFSGAGVLNIIQRMANDVNTAITSKPSSSTSSPSGTGEYGGWMG